MQKHPKACKALENWREMNLELLHAFLLPGDDFLGRVVCAFDGARGRSRGHVFQDAGCDTEHSKHAHTWCTNTQK